MRLFPVLKVGHSKSFQDKPTSQSTEAAARPKTTIPRSSTSRKINWKPSSEDAAALNHIQAIAKIDLSTELQGIEKGTQNAYI